MAAGARFPLGQLDLRMARLDDLRALVGEPITGAVTASVVTKETGGHQQANLQVVGHDIGLAGAASTSRAELSAMIVDPLTHPALNSRIVANGKLAGGGAASVQISLAGPEDAFALRASAELRNLASGDARLVTAGTVNAITRVAAISSLQASWKAEDLHLLAPARIAFGNGIVLDRLRLGLRQGAIEANGRVSPTLDLAVTMRNLPADVAAVFAPGFAADGVLRGEAHLTGTPARPEGKVQLAAAGLRLRTGPGRALPAANVTASAEVAGTSARIDARLTAGPSANLTDNGQLATAPSAPVDLHAVGALDLAMFDPLLTASGRRVAGRVSLDARVGGTLLAPWKRCRPVGGRGDRRLRSGRPHQQHHRHHRSRRKQHQADELARPGRAGNNRGWRLGRSGARGLPVNLEITARNARPLASDLLTASLNADLSLRGEALGKLIIGGKIDVLHAEIGIPNRMPAEVPVLNVRVAGQPSPPPPPPPLAIGLDLTVAAHQIVVRGRGLFAELAGSLKVGGSTAAPEPLGSFHMVRGNLSIAGQTLTFEKGEVGFNGGSLTDPSLNFVATSETSTMSASLDITGTASKPKVTLTQYARNAAGRGPGATAVPPQQLFAEPVRAGFSREFAGRAQWRHLEGGDPLGGLRQQLGLEQLSIGTGANGNAALQVGRYVAPGVYIGAQQGAGSNSSQAKVEIDIAKGLKVVGTVGTGANATPGATPAESAGTSLGLKYQFEY